LIARSIALLLAVVFGMYPAVRASRLSPMEAMS
jgi:ABC-type antimicrobial peptide transport system permease subunit